MSDETKLNIELTEIQSAIESTLLEMKPEYSAIDQDSLMYQAGWAAAMAECDSRPRRDSKATKPESRFWPALAMTFAVTTAACLMVILKPPVETVPAIASKNSVEPMPIEHMPAQEHDAGVAIESTTPVALPSQRFEFAQWFGLPVEKIMANRNAQFEKHLTETVSPSQVVLPGGDDDWDLEPTVLLTPRSAVSFSL